MLLGLAKPTAGRGADLRAALRRDRAAGAADRRGARGDRLPPRPLGPKPPAHALVGRRHPRLARGRGAAGRRARRRRAAGASRATRSACASGSGWRRRSWAIPSCSSWTSRPTASTPRACAGCATSCAAFAEQRPHGARLEPRPRRGGADGRPRPDHQPRPARARVPPRRADRDVGRRRAGAKPAGGAAARGARARRDRGDDAATTRCSSTARPPSGSARSPPPRASSCTSCVAEESSLEEVFLELTAERAGVIGAGARRAAQDPLDPDDARPRPGHGRDRAPVRAPDRAALTSVGDISQRENQRSLFGIGSFAGVFSALAGILLVTGEFRFGTIRPTFLFTPRRSIGARRRRSSASLAGRNRLRGRRRGALGRDRRGDPGRPRHLARARQPRLRAADARDDRRDRALGRDRRRRRHDRAKPGRRDHRPARLGLRRREPALRARARRSGG